MNKTMLTGIIAGIGIAVAGGVAGFTLLGDSMPVDAPETALVADEAVEATTAETNAAPAMPVRQTPSRSVATPQVVAPEATVAEECWDEEVEVQIDPRDDKAIAGTAAGALIGGAVADRLGDDNDLVTAAGAAAGALLGRKAQRQLQENRTETRIERRCAPEGTR